jgi:hypothetical protein
MSVTISGEGSITLGTVRVASPSPPHTYLGVAQSLAPGVEVLAGSAQGAAIPLCLLAAHQAECILKAYLSRTGNDARLKHQDIRHNLVKLWLEAANQGLNIASTPPGWLVRLGELHDKPYYLRYSTGVHGLVSPSPKELSLGLRDLLAKVEKSL